MMWRRVLMLMSWWRKSREVVMVWVCGGVRCRMCGGELRTIVNKPNPKAMSPVFVFVTVSGSIV